MLAAALMAAVLASGMAAQAPATLQGRVTIGAARGLPDAVVYLEPLDRATAPPPPPDPAPARVDQRRLKFIPHVLVIPVGTVVEFANSDAVLHNIFAPGEGSDEAFDLGTWPRGETRSYRFDQPGVTVLLCKVHPEMEAYIVVVPSRLFAASDADGTFTIPGVAPGRYTVHVWHERCHPLSRPLTVPESGASRLDLTLEPLFSLRAPDH